MSDEDFVNALKLYAFEGAVSDVRRLLDRPPGRAPRKDVVRLSNWYLALPDRDREMVLAVARLSADASVFGVLAILDGARAWETSDRGDLRLLAGDGEDLNPNHELHGLFRSAVDEDR